MLNNKYKKTKDNAMKKNYIQPAVEVIELAVESGFQASANADNFSVRNSVGQLGREDEI